MASYPPLGTPVGPTPGRQSRGNIALSVRPRYRQPDGSESTVYSTSFEEDGQEILVPRITDDGRLLSEEDAVEEYRRTGKHLGMFGSAEDATAYSQRLHQAQEERPPFTPGEAKRKGILRALQEMGP